MEIDPLEPSDAELVRRARGGDAPAFGALSARHYRMVWVLAYQKTRSREDAEDLVQEALVRAYRALDSLRDERKFASWLYNITLKLCIDWIRRQARRTNTVELSEAVEGRAHSGRLPQQRVGAELEAQEERRRIMEQVSELPDKYRVVITLRYVDKLSYREIALRLDEPAGTVANRLHRATRMLRDRLQARAREGSS